MSRENQILFESIIAIDLSKNPNQANPDYSISSTNNSVHITLKQKNTAYKITFGEMSESWESLEISGSHNNEVSVSQSDLKFTNIAVSANTVILKEDLNIKSTFLNLKADEIENCASIVCDKVKTTINDGGIGLVNYGSLSVNDEYHQTKGDFINKNDFDTARLLIQEGGLTLNDMAGKWTVRDEEQISGYLFENAGNRYARTSLIACSRIKINGFEDGNKGKFQAQESLEFSENSYCSYRNFLGLSRDQLSLDGFFYNSGNVQFSSKTMNIESSALFGYCMALGFSASHTFKCSPKATFIQIKLLLVKAGLSFIENALCDIEEIHLEGLENLVIPTNAQVTSPNIVLSGNDIRVNGLLSGNVYFPQKMNSLFLAEESEILNSKTLRAESNFINALGKVQADITQLMAAISIQTAETTHFEGLSASLQSFFLEVAGKYSVKGMRAYAEQLLNLSPQLKITADILQGKAPLTALNGQIDSAVQISSDVISNDAIILNKTVTELDATLLLLNKQNSNTQSDNVALSAAHILQDGSVTALSRITETGAFTYNSSTSSLNAPQNNIKGSASSTLGGKIQGVNLEVNSGDITSLLTNAIDTHTTFLQAQNNYSGYTNVRGINAQIVAKNKAYFVKGNASLSDKLTVSSPHLYLDIAVDADTLNLIKPTNPGNSDVSIAGLIRTQSFFENFDKCELFGEIDTKRAEFRSQDSVTADPDSKITYTERVEITTGTCNMDCPVYQPQKAEGNAKQGVEIKAIKTRTGKYFEADTQSPVTVDTNESEIAGRFRVLSFTMNGEKMEFVEGLHFSPETGKVQVNGKSNSSTLNIKRGALVEAKVSKFENFHEMTVNGLVKSSEITAKNIKNLLIVVLGEFGSKQSKLFVDADYVTLEGIIKAAVGYIKCSRSFIQIGLRGPAEIDATKIVIQTLLYQKIFGNTKAQQMNCTSLLSLNLGLSSINYEVDNSLLNFRILPSFTNLKALRKTISGIKDGKISIFDTNFLQYSVQMVLAGLRFVLPKTTMVLSLLLSLFFMGTQARQLYAQFNNLNFKELKLVDLLPLLVSLKNIGVSTALAASNGIAMQNQLKEPAIETFQSIEKFFTDLPQEIKDFFQAQTSNTTPPATTGNTFFSNLAGDIEGLFSKSLECVEQFIQNTSVGEVATVTEAIASVILPSTYSDALINIKLLNFSFMPIESYRGFLNFSALSPSVLASDYSLAFSNVSVLDPKIAFMLTQSGFFTRTDLSPALAYNYSLTGHDTVSDLSPVKAENLSETGSAHLKNLSNVEANNAALSGKEIVAGENMNVTDKLQVNTEGGVFTQAPGSKIEAGSASIKVDEGQFVQGPGSEIKADKVDIKEDTARPHTGVNTKDLTLEYKNVDKEGNEKFRREEDEKIKASAKTNHDLENKEHQKNEKHHRGENYHHSFQIGDTSKILAPISTPKTENTPVDTESDLLHLSGEYSCYVPHDPKNLTVTFITDHKLTLDDENWHPLWSLNFKAAEIVLPASTQIIAPGKNLSFTTTKGSIEIDGIVKADTIVVNSADSVKEKGGVTESKNLNIKAENDFIATEAYRDTQFFLDHKSIPPKTTYYWQPSSNVADYGSVITKHGNIVEDASKLTFNHSGEVNAGGNVIAKCESSNTWTNNAPDKIYRPAVISGGDGLNLENPKLNPDKVGLIIHAEGTITNDASYMGAKNGKVYIDGNKGVIGKEQDNVVCVYSNKHLGWGGPEEKYVYTERINGPVFQAYNSDLFINSRDGTINSQCGVFIANNTTIHTNTAPIFGDLLVHTVTDKSSWFNSSHHVKSEFVGQIFKSPESLNIRSEHGDIDIPNSSIKTGVLIVDAVEGKTRFGQSPIQYDFYDTYLTLSAHLGPINFSISSNPNDNQPKKLWVSDPLKDSLSATKHSNRKNGEIIGNLLNTADAAAGKINAYQDGNYAGMVDTTVGLGISRTTTESHFQTPGNNSIVAGLMIDNSKYGLEFDGIPVFAGQMELRGGQFLTVNGFCGQSSTHSSTESLGVNWQPGTNKLDLNASYSNFNSHSSQPFPGIMKVGRLVFQKEAELSLNNAQATVGKLEGEIKTVNIIGALGSSEQTSECISASTDTASPGLKAASISDDKIVEKTVVKSSLSVDNSSKTHIDTINSVSGELEGDGFKKNHPDLINKTELKGERHEKGFSASVNLEKKSITSFGITDTSGFDKKGIDLTLTDPKNLEELYSRAQESNKPKNDNAGADSININNLFAKEYIFDPNNSNLPVNTNSEKSSAHTKPEKNSGNYKGNNPGANNKGLDASTNDQSSKSPLPLRERDRVRGASNENGINLNELVEKEKIYQDPAMNNAFNPTQFSAPSPNHNNNNSANLSDINSIPSYPLEDPSINQKIEDQIFKGPDLSSTPSNQSLNINNVPSNFKPEDPSLHLGQNPNTAFTEPPTNKNTLDKVSDAAMAGLQILPNPIGFFSYLFETNEEYIPDVIAGAEDAIKALADQINHPIDKILKPFVSLASDVGFASSAQGMVLTPALDLPLTILVETNPQLAKEANNRIQERIDNIGTALYNFSQASAHEKVRAASEFATSFLASGGAAKVFKFAAGATIGKNFSDFRFVNVTEDSKELKYLYRGDGRDPKQIFSSGFEPAGNNLSVIKLMTGSEGEDLKDSAYVPTTWLRSEALKFPDSSNYPNTAYPKLEPFPSLYVYKINPQKNGIHAADPLRAEYHAMGEEINEEDFERLAKEQEMLIPGKINPHDIMGAWPVKVYVAQVTDPEFFLKKIAKHNEVVDEETEVDDEFIYNMCYEETRKIQEDSFIQNPDYMAPIELQKSHWVEKNPQLFKDAKIAEIAPKDFSEFGTSKPPRIFPENMNSDLITPVSKVTINDIRDNKPSLSKNTGSDLKSSSPINEPMLNIAENSKTWFRGDFRDPEEIFPIGFEPTGDDRSVLKHTYPVDSQAMQNSAYVSVSRLMEEAKNFPHCSLFKPFESHTIWVYELAPQPNAIDGAKAVLEERAKENSLTEYVLDNIAKYAKEQEMLVDGKIIPQHIIRAYEVNVHVVQTEDVEAFKARHPLAEEDTIYEYCYEQVRTFTGKVVENPNFNALAEKASQKIAQNKASEVLQNLMILGVMNEKLDFLASIFFAMSENYKKHGLLHPPHLFEDTGLYNDIRKETISPSLLSVSWVKENGISNGLYVIDYDGNLLVGAEGLNGITFHSNLSRGPVTAAGKFSILDNDTIKLDNFSGHFKPYGEDIEKIVKHAFLKSGFKEVFYECLQLDPFAKNRAREIIFDWCQNNPNRKLSDLEAVLNETLCSWFTYKNPDKSEFSDFVKDLIREVDTKLLSEKPLHTDAKAIDSPNSEISKTLQASFWSPIKNSVDSQHRTSEPKMAVKMTEEGIIISADYSKKLTEFLIENAVTPIPGESDAFARFVVWQGFSPDCTDQELKKIIRAQGFPIGKSDDLVNLTFGVLFHKFMNLNLKARARIPKVFVVEETPEITPNTDSSPQSPAQFFERKIIEIPNIPEQKENKK